MDIREEKVEVRKVITEKLKNLSSDEIKWQSKAISQKVLDLPAYQAADTLAIFLSIPQQEVETNEIVTDALAKGKHVFVPYIHSFGQHPTKVIDMLQLRNVEDLESLKRDRWGIPSLSRESTSDRRNALGGIGLGGDQANAELDHPMLDVIFMPAVAFDHRRNRLGHGKGFYDRYLARYKEASQKKESESAMPTLVGLALKEQVLPSNEVLPTSEDDWKVDMTISP